MRAQRERNPWRLPRRLRLLALAFSCASCLVVAIPLASVAQASIPATATYWGASIGGGAPWNWKPVKQFAGAVRKPLSLVGIGVRFAQCNGSCGFPTPAAKRVRSHGALPFISWSSAGVSSLPNQPKYTLSAIASGRFDREIRSFARGAKRWGHPFFLRFDWEMNGNWFPWGMRVNGNTPAQYVAAWRHVHNIFTRVGVRNASWAWCPNVDPTNYGSSLYHLYPGSKYVDWTCLDGYNWGSTGPGSPGAQRGGWVTFNYLFARSYAQITQHIARGKPMILGEVATSVDGGSSAAWISNMFHLLKTRYTDIKGFVYYDVPNMWNFAVHAKTAEAHAFHVGLESSAYASNVLCRLGKTGGFPIQPRLIAAGNPFCAAD